MRVEELAKKANNDKTTITRQAKKAYENKESLLIDGIRYKVSKKRVSGVNKPIYWFEEIKEKKVELELKNSDKAWLRADESKKQEAILKAGLVALWERRQKRVSFDVFIKSLPDRYEEFGEISEASFFRWVKRVREAKERGIPPAYVLIDSRGGDRGTKKIDKEMGSFIERLILEKPHRKVKRVWEYVVNRYKEDAPSYTTIKRYIEKFKEKNAFLVKVSEDPTKAVSLYRPAFGQADSGVAYRNQLWELDATPADIMTSDGKRMILSAAIDVYSRRVVVVLAESASFETLSWLFRKAIMKLGIPESVKTDNGKDYRSNNFGLMCSRLGIEQILTPPYSGYYKPHIERFFRTLSHELFEELEGYIGHSVADREKLQNQQSFVAKLEAQKRWQEEAKSGNEFAKKFALKKENKGTLVRVPMSKVELENWIDKWIVMYENRLHRGINSKPIEKWEASEVAVRRISDVRVLNVMVGLSEVKRVTKKGIRVQNIYYTASELWEFVGQSVIVLTDDELGRVYVYDSEYNYICTATNEEFEGKSRAEYIKATKRFDKRLRAYVKALEELRAESSEYMREHIEAKLGEIEEQVKEIGYEEKSEVTKSVIEALEDNGEEVHSELKDESVVVVENKRPVFNSPYDRFVWELKHNCISDKTKELAKKYKESWEAANKVAS